MRKKKKMKDEVVLVLELSPAAWAIIINNIEHHVNKLIIQ
jgi:hypothetical protein